MWHCSKDPVYTFTVPPEGKSIGSLLSIINCGSIEDVNLEICIPISWSFIFSACSRSQDEQRGAAAITSGSVTYVLLFPFVKAQKDPWLLSATVTWRKFIYIIFASVKITGIFIAQEEVCVAYSGQSLLGTYWNRGLYQENALILILCGSRRPEPATL